MRPLTIPATLIGWRRGPTQGRVPEAALPPAVHPHARRDEREHRATFAGFFEFVDIAREQHPRAKVLVHCEVGVSRSATLATALVMKRSRAPFFEAYCDVRAKRHEVLPNIGFASQLQRLELDMHPRRDDDASVSSLARYLREICRVPVELETIQDALHRHDYDALRAIQAIFGDDIPRVIQGVRA